MIALPYPRADRTLLRRHQQLVDLRELRRTQTVKRIVEMNLKCRPRRTPLSHAFVARSETLAAHVS